MSKMAVLDLPATTPLSRRLFLSRAALGMAGLAASWLPLRAAAADRGRRKHILIGNAWHDINIGDIAHTPGLIHLIETYLPECDVTLWPVPTLKGLKARELAPATRRMLTASFPDLTIIQAGDAHQAPARRPDLVAAIERADLFILGSGGYHGRPVEVWRASTNKPYGIYGVTYRADPAQHRKTLAGASFVFLRDSRSQQAVRRAAIKGPVVDFGPDSTFALHLRDEERALHYMERHGLSDKAFICVVPRLRYSPYPEIYGYEPSEAERRNARVNQELKNADHAMLREMIVNWVRATRLKVLLCPEMTYGVAVAKEQIFDQLPPDVQMQVVWRDSFWYPDEAASTYARAIAVVSFDCHSAIIALVTGTPMIHVRLPTDNPFKSRMFADIGLPESLHEHSAMTGERLTSLLMEIFRDPAGSRRKVDRAMAVVRDRQQTTMATVRKVLFT